MRLLTALLLIGVPLVAAPEGLQLRSKQVAPHSYYVEGAAGMATVENRGFNSNAGFVITNDGVVVFDALGTPELGRALVEEIGRRTPLPIRYLIVGHYHADHAYGAVAFREAGAEIWMHQDARIYLNSERADERREQRRRMLPNAFSADFSLPRADRWLSGDERLSIGGVEIELRHVGPAHAPDDLVMLVPADGVMFSGDLLFAGRIPFLGDASSARWLRALEQLNDPRITTFVPGHGPASTAFGSTVSLTRSYLRDLRRQMGSAVIDMLSFDDAYRRADWSRWRTLPAFEQAHRGNAYTVFLEMEQESLARPPG